MITPTQGRTIIDARSQPIVITTVPAQSSQLVLRQARTSREGSGQPVSSSMSRPRVIATVCASVVSVAGTGFALGFAGIGERTLVLVSGALAVVCAGFALLSLLAGMVGGSRGAHCPGPWHK